MAVRGLQERMNDMQPYFRGMEMYNDAIMVKVMYPPKWRAYGSIDERIKVTPADDNPSLLYYYADSKLSTYDEIFDLIEETIKVNNEMKLKIELLKTKVEELKELFSNTPYEDLQYLKFSIEKPKKTRVRRKSTHKEKTSQSAPEQAREASSEQVEKSELMEKQTLAPVKDI